MSNKCLKLICDGELEIVKITEDLYDAAEELFRNSFMKNENLCRVTHLLDCQTASDELITYFRTILKHNISFAARHRATQKIVGLCVNKFVNPSNPIIQGDLEKSSNSNLMRFIMDYVDRMDHTYDIFKEWNVDCVVDLTFLSTHEDFGRKGIATSLTEFTLDYVRKLAQPDSEESESLPQHLRGQRPQALKSIFTSRFSQKVGEKLGFESLLTLPNTEFSYDGKTLAESVAPVHKKSVFAAIRL